MLTQEQIETRASILVETDDPACEDCGRKPERGAAEDEGWFIDTEASDGCDLAIIRCPACW